MLDGQILFNAFIKHVGQADSSLDWDRLSPEQQKKWICCSAEFQRKIDSERIDSAIAEIALQTHSSGMPTDLVKKLNEAVRHYYDRPFTTQPPLIIEPGPDFIMEKPHE